MSVTVGYYLAVGVFHAVVHHRASYWWLIEIKLLQLISKNPTEWLSVGFQHACVVEGVWWDGTDESSWLRTVSHYIYALSIANKARVSFTATIIFMQARNVARTTSQNPHVHRWILKLLWTDIKWFLSRWRHITKLNYERKNVGATEVSMHEYVLKV